MSNFLKKLKQIGPAAIVTSAFVGPGTITTATIAGSKFGYQLLWAVLFSGISLIILLEMASRTGIVTQKNIVDSSIDVFKGNVVIKAIIKTVVFLAVLFVALAFQAGNIVGSSLGLGDILSIDGPLPAIIVGAIALYTAVCGSYKVLERIMLFFVGIMGIVFFLTMIIVKPDLVALAKGLIPTIPEGGTVNTIALIGTTLIGINLILHSITSSHKWKTVEDLENARFDIRLNVTIGIVITMSIIIASGTVLLGKAAEINSPIAFSLQLKPILGDSARIIGDIGLFSAGLSSAVAVPFTLKSIFAKLFNWEGGIESTKAKVVGALAVIFGTTIAITGKNPIQIILAAQAISGFTLPFIATLLMIVANNKKLMKEHTNKLFHNILGFIAIGVTFYLGITTILNVINKLLG